MRDTQQNDVTIPLIVMVIGMVWWGFLMAIPESTPAEVLQLTPVDDSAATEAAADPPLAAPRPAIVPQPEWISLFDGQTLDGWKATQFGGEGQIRIEDGALVLGFGSNMTGVTTTREDFPRMNYEVSMLAQRVDGSDFFCGMTFPVKDSFLSLILGGWGGGVCGLSSIDGFDASENQTTQFRQFRKGEWYRVKLRVTEDRIVAWLDGERIIDQELADRKLSIRIEVELSCPFGLSTWQTTGAIKDLKLRKLTSEEIPTANADAD